MKKIILALLLFFPFSVYSLELSSKSALVYNKTNDNIIYEKNINEKLPIASLTKIMTVLVSLENIEKLDDKVNVEKDDLVNLSSYSIVGLKKGDIITYEELLYSTILKSAADASMVLANNVFNDYDLFITKMNELADKIGMNNTQFSNPVGFDKDNYSTANDLILLLNYALDNNVFREIYETKNYTLESLNIAIKNNVNNYIKNNIDNFNNINFDGFKSGYTKKSGLCLSANIILEENELIIVTLGAIGEMDSKLHLIDSVSLLNEIKNSYSNRVIIKKDKLIDNIIYINNDKEFNYKILNDKTIKYYLKNSINLDYLRIYYDGKTTVNNNDLNKKIGVIRIEYENNTLSEVDVVFDKKILLRIKRTILI